MKHLKIVEANRAEKSQRFGNYFIDLIIFYIVLFFFWTLTSFFAPAFVYYISENSLLDRLISVVGYVIFMFIIESATKGRSIGKYITGTKVVMIDGTTPTFSQFFIRNIIRGIILVDQFSFFGDTGFHDQWSKTRVVKVNDYERAIIAKEEIQNIGKKEIE